MHQAPCMSNTAVGSCMAPDTHRAALRLLFGPLVLALLLCEVAVAVLLPHAAAGLRVVVIAASTTAPTSDRLDVTIVILSSCQIALGSFRCFCVSFGAYSGKWQLLRRCLQVGPSGSCAHGTNLVHHLPALGCYSAFVWLCFIGINDCCSCARRAGGVVCRSCRGPLPRRPRRLEDDVCFTGCRRRGK